MQRGRQFFPSPADGIDVQARDPGDEPIPTVPELGTLDGGVPTSLLLIEPTEQEIHLPVDLLVGMMIQAQAVGALALMDFLLGHGPTLRDRLLDSVTSLPKSVEIVLGWPQKMLQPRNHLTAGFE
jgi:hypothetical protein